ncbi:MAG: PspC family transcriptional regulator [Sphingobacteriaceae bacterium]|nr:PspC family transcriptional regulator [Sphingobacteriaceae bacterium]
MQKLVNTIKDFFENQAFGVCDYLSEKFDLPTARVRNVFIYVSLLSLGSPIVFYMITAFWLNLKSYFKRKSIIWD